ncbi:hypothetical protein [Aegicerativicinus sediminis]
MKLRMFIKQFFSLTLSLILLFSCSVYQKSSLEELSTINKKVLIKTNDNKRLKYYRVVKKDQDYWGQTKLKDDKFEEAKIDPQQVKEAKKKNTALSAVATASLGVIPATLAAIALVNLWLSEAVFN